MLNKLTIVNGIIQDKFIDGITVKLAIIEPVGKHNVRTLELMKEIIGLTYHNTANTSATAGDEAHARYFDSVEKADTSYVGAHLFVDCDSITQVLPINEVAFHAGDGKGSGNRKTVAIEICENKDVAKAEENAKKLGAAFLLTYPKLGIFKHQDWSGKYCPRVILKRNGWTMFVTDIVNLKSTASQTPIMKKTAVSVAQAKEWVRSKGASQEFIDLAPLFWKIANEVGVNAAGAYAQSAKETGYGNFGGVLDASYHNPCGMKTTKGGGNYDRNAHQRFDEWEDGIAAQIDHLALYAGALGYPKTRTMDPGISLG